MKKLNAAAKRKLEEDNEAESKRKPTASSCGGCGDGHPGVNGTCKGKGYGQKGSKVK